MHFWEWDFKVKFGIYYISAKKVQLPQNKMRTYQLNGRPQMGSSGLTLAMTLTLNFQVEICNLLYLSHIRLDCHETKSKHIDWMLGLKWDHRVWPWLWPWPWIVKVKSGLLYIRVYKGFNCHKRKSKHINWMLGLKLDHRVWLWPWPWPWIFKLKSGLCCI